MITFVRIRKLLEYACYPNPIKNLKEMIIVLTFLLSQETRVSWIYQADNFTELFISQWTLTRKQSLTIMKHETTVQEMQCFGEGFADLEGLRFAAGSRVDADIRLIFFCNVIIDDFQKIWKLTHIFFLLVIGKRAFRNLFRYDVHAANCWNVSQKVICNGFRNILLVRNPIFFILIRYPISAEKFFPNLQTHVIRSERICRNRFSGRSLLSHWKNLSVFSILMTGHKTFACW